MWCDIIKSGCDVLCSSYDVIHIVAMLSTYNGGCMIDNLGVMTEIHCLCCQIVSVWVRFNSFEVMSRGCDVINRG